MAQGKAAPDITGNSGLQLDECFASIPGIVPGNSFWMFSPLQQHLIGFAHSNVL